MKTIRFLALIGLLTGLLFQSGCTTPLTPKTADLAHLHDVYADEFAAVATPSPAGTLEPGKPASGDAFARSLRAIHEYRLKYPGDSQELAHLKVLEGMIYLQSGRFGLATAMKDEVKSAESTLASARGKVIRDQLFAQNYGTLLEGWSETKKVNNRSWQTFERVADDLAGALNRIPSEQRADVDTDQGALYLAASSAIFYVWSAQQIAMSTERASAPERKKEWYQKGRDVIGQFLTDAEKAPGVSADLGNAPQGRLRYLQWYHWLNDEAEPPNR